MKDLIQIKIVNKLIYIKDVKKAIRLINVLEKLVK